jgi:transcriptional regulator with PAS, ATPase and Fis domain
VESELFGIEKGVATGVLARKGKFEAAHGGTVFLDELADLSLSAQAKLLRVLQERTLERVGSHRSIPIDVRVIAATNKNLEEAIEKGAFRADLYYRLNAVQIHMPSLREIRTDIPLLANSFLCKHSCDLNRVAPEIEPRALAGLTEYSWPGNVRELDNEMQRLTVTVRSDRITWDDLPTRIKNFGPAAVQPSSSHDLKRAVEQLERSMIQSAMVECHNNQLQAARLLGISRQGLIKKLKRYSLELH